MNTLLLLSVCFFSITAALCSNAHAEAHVHDGLFLRVAPGVGWNGTSKDIGGDATDLTGFSGMLNFAIGVNIARNLALHLDVSGVSGANSNVANTGSGQSSEFNYITSSSVGIGVTYYIPSNYYLSGAVGRAETNKRSGGVILTTDPGYGVNVMLGKEWWVSDEWGIGFAGQFLYTLCPDRTFPGVQTDVKSTSYGILFSATYN
jgi:hypothetical protein